MTNNVANKNQIRACKSLISTPNCCETFFRPRTPLGKFCCDEEFTAFRRRIFMEHCRQTFLQQIEKNEVIVETYEYSERQLAKQQH